MEGYLTEHNYAIEAILKNNVLLVKRDGKFFIYKTSEKQWETLSSIFKKILSILGLNERNFRHEINIHSHLSAEIFNYLKLPHIHDTDGKTFMVMDYIPGEMGRHYTKEMDKILICSLVDLQLSISNKQTDFTESMRTFPRKPLWNVIRTIFTIALPKVGLSLALRCLILTIKLSIKVSPNKRNILLHKDINNEGNIITDEHGIMHFIDFESCMEEKKWILSDIIEIVYSSKDEYMDVELFKVYMEALHKRGFIDDSFDIKSQVRMAMLRNAIKFLGFPSKKESHLNQLYNVILLDENFDMWFDKTFNELDQ